MDGSLLYSEEFHPSRLDHDSKGRRKIKAKLRMYVEPIKYYFIDFGISLKYGPNEPHEAVGHDGQDQELPELHKDIKYYDPFPADVFILGNLYKRNFTKVFIPYIEILFSY